MSVKNKKGQVSIAKVIVFILLVCVAVLVCGLLYLKSGKSSKTEASVSILKEESYLHDFEVINNEVHIYYEISLKNNSSTVKEVKLAGNFPKEAEIGLLKETRLEAYFINNDASSITIQGNATLQNIMIDFVGEYAGNPQMNSRLLPDIEVIEIDATDNANFEEDKKSEKKTIYVSGIH